MNIKMITIWAMSIFYISVGIRHFTDPSWFVQIMPPALKFIEYELVYISGIFEIAFGAMLLFKETRHIASVGLMLLLVAVYPANIYLAFSEEAQRAINVSAFMASWVRLPIQFVFIGLAYWHSKNIN